MTFDEALAKRNEARKARTENKDAFADLFEKASESMWFEKSLNAEYSWGYWDAVITVMKQLKLKDITA
ncbi:MAG: hypothetical protein LBH43_21205 [Treponema sp.]|jgi:hypothetical protein|nr:hypothetical protein [Treponema sp.]